VLRCDETVTVGPGAAWMFYNINIWNDSGPVMSCQSAVGYVAIAAGKYRCTKRVAHSIWADGKGNTATLIIQRQ